MTTKTAKQLAKILFTDDSGRAPEVPVERDGHRAYAGWVRAAGEAGDADTSRDLAAVDEDEFAAEWDRLAKTF